MKISNIKYIALASFCGLALSSCEDFLDRPGEDSYNEGTFYLNDEQCIQGVNYLYNSPWYDFQRGFIKVGEVMSGNYYWGSSPYLTFTVNGTDEDMVKMSYSLWAVIGHSNTVYNSLKGASASVAVKNQCMGECLTWKALAYFYLVRSFGEVPIVHDNSSMLADGSYTNCYKTDRASVYEYIIMTLEKAMEHLQGVKSPGTGRIDYYSAEALLAKVYLTRSGLGANGNGQRSTSDLAKAAELAKDVIDNSGRTLLENYGDNFRMEHNQNVECLISWQWANSRNPWTQQNSLQDDLAPNGFGDFGGCWGGWNGLSVDIQEAFGVRLLEQTPEAWINNPDTRLHETMMLPGFKYDYFWRDRTVNNYTGFDFLEFTYNKEYAAGSSGELQSATGANTVKHLYGDAYDHVAATGVSAENMAYMLATHILRLSDVYLIYAEAVIGNNGSTSDADALAAFNAVRRRAIPTMPNDYTTITWEDVWKERRLELAMEGDRWYDFVRRSYYDVEGAMNELRNQKRNAYWGLNTLYQTYYESGNWTITADQQYDSATTSPNINQSIFTLPLPSEDVIFNGNLQKPAINVDVRATYSY